LGDCKSLEGLQKVFSLYDNDLAGYIDFEKMKLAAKELGETMNDE
jgi:Ca2+-binding EF-hand superfamily protein